MARRMIRYDRSDGATLVTCEACGFRAMALTPAAAATIGDRHRTAAHRRQAQYAASKRRTRAGR